MTKPPTPADLNAVSSLLRTRGYFELSIEGLIHVLKNASRFAAWVYFVMASGIDRSKDPRSRGCTFGKKAISERTGLTRQGRVEAAILELASIGSIIVVPPPEGVEENKRSHTEVRYLIDPERTDDLVAIDQRFVDPFHGLKAEKSVMGQRPESDLNRILGCSEVELRGMLATDAVVLFTAMLRRFDLEAYAGVDPSVASSMFQAIEDGELNVEFSHIMFFPTASDLRIVMVRKAGFPLIGEKFADQLFGQLPQGKRTASCLERAEAALARLRELNLVGEAYVLWHDDPRSNVNSVPQTTLYVSGPSGLNDQTYSVQNEIDKALNRTGAIHASVMYPRDRAEVSAFVFHGTGIHRYVTDRWHVKSSVLLSQFRLKWVADTADFRAGMIAQRRSHEAYLRTLDRLA